MPFVPWMWVIWGVLACLFIVFKLFVSRMSRNEDDQIVLQDSFDHVRAEQAAIAARLHRAQPVGYVLLGLLGAMTLYVISYYVLDMIRQFR